MMNKTKPFPSLDEDGFTLIELLIVVVILGILAAIAIPIFVNVQNAAYDSALKSDLRNIGTAVETSRTASATGLTYNLSRIKVPISNKEAMGDVNIHNYIICYAEDGSGFSVSAKGISGKAFTYKSNGVMQDDITWTNTFASMCPNTGFPTATSGYFWLYQSSAWKSQVA